MADNKSMEIRINPIVDQRKLREEFQKVENTFSKVGIQSNFKPSTNYTGLAKSVKQQIGDVPFAQRMSMLPDAASLGAQAAKESGGGLMSQVTGSLDMITTTLGTVGTAVVGILGIVMGFKSVTSLLNGIIKILTEFLRPIADMVTLMLMPILAILRPILRVFQAIMMPFRQAAMQIAAEGMKKIGEGDIAGGLALSMASFSVLFTGIQTVIYDMVSEIIKTLIELQLRFVQIFTSMFDAIFGTNLTGIVGEFVEFSKKTIDNLFSAIIFTNLALLDNHLVALLGSGSETLLNLETFGTLLNSIFEDSTTKLGVVGKEIETLQQQFVSVDNNAKGLINNVESGIVDIKGTLTTYKDLAIMDLWSVKLIWSEVAGTFKSDLETFATNMKSLVSSFETINGWLTKIKSLADTVKSYASSLNNISRGASIGGLIGGPIGSIAGGIVGGLSSKSKKQDFLMRPGQAPVSFSPNDTVVGFKGIQSFGGSTNITNDIKINFNGSGNQSDMRKLAEQIGVEIERQLRRRISY